MKIRDEQYDIGGLDRYLGLDAHLLKDVVLVIAGLDTAGIYHDELSAAPLCIGIDAVTRNTGGIVNYRYPLSVKCVEQARLAHVRATDYCYYGFAHSW